MERRGYPPPGPARDGARPASSDDVATTSAGRPTPVAPAARGEDDGRSGATAPPAAAPAAAAPVDPVAAKREHDASFERDALPCLDDVYRFALSLTRDPADADDVVQDTYLRAYRSWHTFQPGTDCRRWLFTICRNAFLRSRERERHQVDLEDGDVEAVAAVMVHVEAVRDGVDGALTRIDLAPALAGALERLHEPFRSAVVLVDVEDQSYEAASEVLGVPIGTVRSRLFRGRRLLQEMLLEYAADAGIAVPSSATLSSAALSSPLPAASPGTPRSARGPSVPADGTIAAAPRP